MVGATALRPGMAGQQVMIRGDRSPQAGGPQAGPASEAQPAQAGQAVWADRATFNGVPPYQPPVVNPTGRTYQAQSLIPFWAKAATFCGVWGIWGFPAALLGAAGFWLVEKVARSV